LTPEAELSLLGRLSQQVPEATETNLDDVIAEFRRLLSEEMARNGGRLHLAQEDSQARRKT
jgi:L-lactate utilization protein LutB